MKRPCLFRRQLYSLGSLFVNFLKCQSYVYTLNFSGFITNTLMCVSRVNKNRVTGCDMRARTFSFLSDYAFKKHLLRRGKRKMNTTYKYLLIYLHILKYTNTVAIQMRKKIFQGRKISIIPPDTAQCDAEGLAKQSCVE